MAEPGRKYYFIVHAYHHFLGELVEMTGLRAGVIRNVARVYACKRGWTEFWRDGCKKDTTLTIWPDNIEITWMVAVPWSHSIPTEELK